MNSFPITLRHIIPGILLTTTAAAPAFANHTVEIETEADHERSGLVLGASVDGGNMGCQTKSGHDCGDGRHLAAGLSVHVGTMLGPRLALLAEGWGMQHRENDFTATQAMATANLRAWLSPHLWLQGGAGFARSKLEFSASGLFEASTTSSTVPAVNAALGLELAHSPSFGLDLELRAGSGLYQSDVRIYNASLGVGLSFF